MKRLWNLIATLCVIFVVTPVVADTPSKDEFFLEVIFLDDEEQPVLTKKVPLDEIMSLPVAQIRTTTIWTEGEQQFQGVWLKDLIDHLGVTEGTLDFSALNEYLVEIPMDDIVRGGPLVAYEWNGNRMSARDKGPLWVVFPYDSDIKFQTESVFAQSIWQLDRVEVYR